jgi:hypothetical protein
MLMKLSGTNSWDEGFGFRIIGEVDLGREHEHGAGRFFGVTELWSKKWFACSLQNENFLWQAMRPTRHAPFLGASQRQTLMRSTKDLLWLLYTSAFPLEEAQHVTHRAINCFKADSGHEMVLETSPNVRIIDRQGSLVRLKQVLVGNTGVLKQLECLERSCH